MIVLTGATGTVGSQVVEHLNEKGQKFRVVARDLEKVPQRHNIERVKAAYDDRAALDKALAGATKVFVLTSSVPDAVQWQKNIIDAAKKNGAKHVVRLSAAGSDTNSPLTLGKWHGETDAYLKANAPSWTILQPGNFMSNLLSSAATIKKDGAFYGAAKAGKFAVIDPRDIGAVAAKALTEEGHAGQTYLLTGKEALSYPEMADKLGHMLGKTVKYVDITPEQFKAALISAHLPEWLANDFVWFQTTAANGGMAHIDPTAQTLLGKVHTFDSFLEHYGSAFR